MTVATTTYIRRDNLLERWVQSKLFWSLTLSFLFIYPIVRSIYRELPPELPRYYQIPSFELINEFGQPFGNKNLENKIYLASFAFTSCATICPGLMEKLKIIQKRVRGLGNKIAIVTFTVDPENDTPKVLHKYARSLRANPHIWSFLTGERKQLKSLLVGGYKVPMGEEAEEFIGKVDGNDVSLMDIAHTGKIVLVDKNGYARGYYSTDDTSVDQLMIDVGLLVNRRYN